MIIEYLLVVRLLHLFVQFLQRIDEALSTVLFFNNHRRMIFGFGSFDSIKVKRFASPVSHVKLP